MQAVGIPILTLIILLGFATLFLKLLKIKFEISIFLAISIIISALYVSVIYDHLALITEILIYFGVGLFAYFALSYFAKKRISLLENFSSPVVAYVLLIAFLWIRLSTQKLILWDDFSHWGLATKDLYFSNALPTLDGVVRFLDYPPGGALFNYFVLSIPDALRWHQQKIFSESVALFAQGVVLITALFPIIGYAFRQTGVRFGSMVLGTLLLSIFAFGYTPATLMIDLVVAIYFGSAIAIYIITGRNLASVIYLTPILICLVILKSVGLFLSSVIVLIVAVDQLQIIYGKVKSIPHKKNLWKVVLISIIVLICLPLAVFDANLSWKLHVKELGAQTTFKTKITAQDVKRAMFGNASEKETKVKQNFLKQLAPVDIEYPPGITQVKLQNTALLFLLITFLSIYVLRKQAAKGQFQEFRYLAILFCGFLLYAFGLLLLYFFSFSEYEAIRLASFDRYLGIYLLGWFIALLAIIFAVDIYDSKVILIIFSVSLLFGGGGALYFIKGSKYEVVPKFSNSMERLLDQAKVPRNSETKIYFISQCDTGFNHVIFKSVAYPIKVSPAPFSIGEPCGSDDAWTADLSVNEWRKSLMLEYDYVVLANVNQKFVERFGHLFNILPSEYPSIYSIDKKSGMLINVITE